MLHTRVEGIAIAIPAGAYFEMRAREVVHTDIRELRKHLKSSHLNRFQKDHATSRLPFAGE
jgi:hypothetical protein